ncbi:hypothetical protein EJ08DRAFT_441447 [Tothia fuscella]|uniref:Uncharacterized protein n=1 Tax=Tothia fuscella TaxID=1048955 RepID=A0A9P4NJN6_9PEZI|nr:hypothetical protein EJ08DRAFT_441447 [Tothia fuscella]
MSESLRCFEYLVEAVPLWIKGLEELEQKVKDRHDEITRVAVPVSQQTVKRTGSNESIRPGQEERESSKIMDIVAAPQPNDIEHAQTTQQMHLESRHRKSASLLTTSSGPSKYRSRSSIIVYYDSAIQEAFEHIVRSIGIGRNHIRKARMAARMEALSGASTSYDNGQHNTNFRLPTRSPRNNGNDAGYGATLIQGLRPARGPPIGPDPTTAADGCFSGSANDICTLTDSALDKAQTLCERGAHQFLRDGNCDEETLGAKRCFEEVIVLSGKEVTEFRLLEEERSKIAAAEKQKAYEQQKRESIEAHPGLMIPNGAHIEVDDDEDDDDFDDSAITLPPFRMMTRT